MSSPARHLFLSPVDDPYSLLSLLVLRFYSTLPYLPVLFAMQAPDIPIAYLVCSLSLSYCFHTIANHCVPSTWTVQWLGVPLEAVSVDAEPRNLLCAFIPKK